MKKHTLNGESRNVFGRKSRKLRLNGLIPATVYGKKTDSASVTIKYEDFAKVYAETGLSGLIELTVGKTVYPVLVNNVQIHPVDRKILHVEFHKVDLKEKIHAKVPLEFFGVAKAVTDKVGALLTLIDEVEVEALPTDLPEKISLDVTGLSKLNDELKVKDIAIPSGVTMMTDGAQVVIRVSELVSKQAEAEVAAEAAEAAKVASEAAAVVPPVGEVPTPEEKPTTGEKA